MPTASQWQIMETDEVKQSSSTTEVQSKLATTLETLEIDDDEDDLFRLKALKSKLMDSEDNRAGTRGVMDVYAIRMEQPTRCNKRVRPALPKRVRGKLYGLSFRHSESNMKKNLERLVEESHLKLDQPDTDAIIKSLLHNQPTTRKKLRSPPKSNPRALCFNYPGPDLTHLEVKKALDRLLTIYSEAKVLTIEFQPRRKLFRPDRTENICRWVITFTSESSRNLMTNKEVRLREFSAFLKCYDDIVNLEYKQYVRMVEIMKIVKSN